MAKKSGRASSPKLGKLAVSLGGTRSHSFRFGSDLVERKCPDGSPYWILKHPDKAFQKIYSDWDVNVGATVDQLKGIAGKLGVDLKKKVQNIYETLDNVSENLSKAYTANYLAWAARPCDSKAVEQLRQANERVQHEANLIHLIKLESNRPQPDVALMETLTAQLVIVDKGDA
jgi:hypothetical protein